MPTIVSIYSKHVGCFLQGFQVVISKKGQINPLKKPNSTKKSQIHKDTLKPPKCVFERQYVHILYIKRIKLTPLMNFSKLLVLMKSNLKLQIYKHVIAKQKIINSRAEFPMKIYHCVQKQCLEIWQCPETCQNHV